MEEKRREGMDEGMGPEIIGTKDKQPTIASSSVCLSNRCEQPTVSYLILMSSTQARVCKSF